MENLHYKYNMYTYSHSYIPHPGDMCAIIEKKITEEEKKEKKRKGNGSIIENLHYTGYIICIHTSPFIYTPSPGMCVLL